MLYIIYIILVSLVLERAMASSLDGQCESNKLVCKEDWKTTGVTRYLVQKLRIRHAKLSECRYLYRVIVLFSE